MDKIEFSVEREKGQAKYVVLKRVCNTTWHAKECVAYLIFHFR